VLWALHAVHGVTPEYLQDKDPHVRAWTIQLLCEDGAPAVELIGKLAEMAKSDESPLVRLYLASACQRLTPVSRLPIVEALLSHGEDAQDQNLPFMYWYAAEPIAGTAPEKGAGLLGACQIPKVQEFLARRLAISAK
jgi:hypothetical protein